MKKLYALTLALCLLLTGCGTRTDKSSPLKKYKNEAVASAVRQTAEEGYAALGAQKLSVGILQDGRVRFFSFGDASEDTLYELGRLSQMFTGIAMLSYLDPDAAAEDYFGDAIDLPDWNGQEITVRQLATQTAGLADWPDNLPESDNPCFGYSDRSFLGYLAQTELLYEPGTQSRDSACSLGLLGNLMEWKSGGKNPKDVNMISSRIIKRAGLYSTFLTVPDTKRALRALGHYEDGRVASFQKYDAMGTAGAFYSSAYDMMLFAAACMDQVSSNDGYEPAFPALAREALFRQYTDDAGGRGYGCRVDDLGFGDVAWQESTLGGFGGYFGLCADEGTAVIVLTDTAVSVSELGEEIMTAISKGE